MYRPKASSTRGRVDKAGLVKSADHGLIRLVVARSSFFAALWELGVGLGPRNRKMLLPVYISTTARGTNIYKRKTWTCKKVSMSSVADRAKGVRMRNVSRTGIKNMYSARAQVITTLAGSAIAMVLHLL
jgi:hypothetical protein